MSRLTAYDKFVQQALKYGFSLFGTAKTGQAIVYQAGDDGTYQKGYPSAGVRFVDNGDGTITDKATGLMWAKDGNSAGCNNGSTLAWAAAITFAEGLTFAGYSDWRLPNVKELHSIVDYGTYNPAIDSTFTNTEFSHYWSSTTIASDTGYTWGVHFSSGIVYSGGKKTTANYVRLVRAGQ